MLVRLTQFTEGVAGITIFGNRSWELYQNVTLDYLKLLYLVDEIYFLENQILSPLKIWRRFERYFAKTFANIFSLLMPMSEGFFMNEIDLFKLYSYRPLL